MGKVVIMDHPLVAHKLTIMRDKNTSVKDFRELVSEIGMLITYEATRDLPMTTKHIETPIRGDQLALPGQLLRFQRHGHGVFHDQMGRSQTAGDAVFRKVIENQMCAVACQRDGA